jgi:hypothetical protein
MAMTTPTRTRSFNRNSKVEFFDIEEHLRTDGKFEQKDISTLLDMVKLGSFIRAPGAYTPLDNVLYAISPPIFRGAFPDLHDQFADPYPLELVNQLGEPVQFVWAYEQWDGLILVEQPTYTAPGVSAFLTPTPSFPCPLMRQYAVSAWDTNNEEVGRIPTLTVQHINEIEITKGTCRMCEDTIEIG